MKTLENQSNACCKTKIAGSVTNPGRESLTKIIMETHDLINHRIVLSVLVDREVVKVSPTELLSNPYIVNRLSKAEVQRVAYLTNVQESDAAVCARHSQVRPAGIKRAPVSQSKIVVETQNPQTDKVVFTVLHNRDLVKLSPLELMTRHDMIGQMSKRDTDRMFYMLAMQVESVKTKAETLLAGSPV